jgi:hypothetical protein
MGGVRPSAVAVGAEGLAARVAAIVVAEGAGPVELAVELRSGTADGVVAGGVLAAGGMSPLVAEPAGVGVIGVATVGVGAAGRGVPLDAGLVAGAEVVSKVTVGGEGEGTPLDAEPAGAALKRGLVDPVLMPALVAVAEAGAAGEGEGRVGVFAAKVGAVCCIGGTAVGSRCGRVLLPALVAVAEAGAAGVGAGWVCG